jgi:hypothetical protein
MWKAGKDGNMTRYSGNDTVDMIVAGINDSANMDIADPDVFLNNMSSAVLFTGATRFSNGSAAKDWKDGTGF